MPVQKFIRAGIVILRTPNVLLKNTHDIIKVQL